jgi:Ca2+-binding RTX toxin-like protein
MAVVGSLAVVIATGSLSLASGATLPLAGVDPVGAGASAQCPQDDGFEENDTPPEAVPVPTGQLLSAVVCSFDRDWYTFSATAGQDVAIDILFLHSDGNLDAELDNSSGTILATSESLNDNERLIFTPPYTGIYYLYVYGVVGAEADYDFFIDPAYSAPRCNGLEVTVDLGMGDAPTAGADVILGTAGDDVIYALDGDDTVCAGDGDDLVIGGPGDDLIFGEDGDDTMSGNTGFDGLVGGPGRDRLFGGSGNDYVSGDAGDDSALGGGSGTDSVLGGSGDDVLSGGGGNDIIVSGGPGRDAVNGGGGNDASVFGDEGDDTVSGNGGNDSVFGGAGNDQVRGGAGDDMVRGNAGNDFLAGNAGYDTCDGGTEADAAAANCEVLINVP